MRIGGIELKSNSYKIRSANPNVELAKGIKITQGISIESNKMIASLDGQRTEFFINKELAESLTHLALSNSPSAIKTLKNAFKKENITSIIKNELNLELKDDYDDLNDKEFLINKRGGLYKFMKQNT